MQKNQEKSLDGEVTEEQQRSLSTLVESPKETTQKKNCEAEKGESSGSSSKRRRSPSSSSGSDYESDSSRSPSSKRKKTKKTKKSKKSRKSKKTKKRRKRLSSSNSSESDCDPEFDDVKRFQITPKYEENKYNLPSKLVDYAKCNFEVYIPEADIEENVLNTNPVPSNLNVVRKMDDFLKPLVSSYCSNLDSTVERFQSRLLQTMGPLSKVWMTLEEVRSQGREGRDVTVPVDDIIGWLEQAILVLGQASNHMTYSRRLNILKSILKDQKQCKSLLKEKADLFPKDDENLFGKTFTSQLIETQKSNKAAQEVFQDKKGKNKQPFRASSSRYKNKHRGEEQYQYGERSGYRDQQQQHTGRHGDNYSHRWKENRGGERRAQQQQPKFMYQQSHELNLKMHERNIFKSSRPDFDSLAQEYPEFKKYLQVGKSGKSYLCFKDPASLRALSYALLKKYFQISLDIPLDRLIPTIPLRLNYVHWVEDLIGLNKVNVSGIDIGCGASCIYGLLGYRLNQWKIFATELDETSYEYANKNVHNNDATQYIKVWKVGSDQNYFMPIMNSSTVEQFEFSMCNPPFFDEMADNEEKNRTSRRPPPACASTASDLESFTSGGEVNFIEKMIEESCNIQKRIRWFTTMLGKKSSLKTLKKILKEKKIFHTFTTFQQGKTLRWGLAWSFTETSLQFDPSKKEKKAKAFEVCVEKDYLHKYSLDGKDHCTVLYNIIKHVENEFTRLQLEIQEQIEHITIANHDSFEMIACAFKNTWVHQRRKRREEKRLKNAQDSKNTASCVHSENTNSKNCEDTNGQTIPLKRGHDKTSLNPDCKKIKLEEIERKEYSREVIFHLSCSVSTRKEECDDVRYFVTFLCSEGDKDQCHQLCLYMNNFLKLQAT